MIEIKESRDKDMENIEVPVPYKDLAELLEYKRNTIRLLGDLKVMVLERYIENFACFGNGGIIAYEELAGLLGVDLPRVPYMGMDKYLEFKKEMEEEQNERKDS